MVPLAFQVVNYLVAGLLALVCKLRVLLRKEVTLLVQFFSVLVSLEEFLVELGEFISHNLKLFFSLYTFLYLQVEVRVDSSEGA